MDPILEKIRRAARPRVLVSIWSVNQLMAWLDEVEPIADRRGKFDWLEIPPIASSMAIQEAYHQVARSRHPDLFRARVDHRTMDRLVRMYARVTAAYAELKDPEKCAAYMRELRGPRPVTAPPTSRDEPPPMVKRSSSPSIPPIAAAPPPPVAARPGPAPIAAAPPATATSARPDAGRDAEPSRSMNARALTHYRRAEGFLKTGDRTSAVLELKMAILADPKSSFLRAALLEAMKA